MSRGVLLGPASAQSVPLIVVRDGDRLDGQTIKVCSICFEFGRETKFYLPDELRAWERHFEQCYSKHEHELRSKSLHVKAPTLFGPESGDPELTRWVDENRDALIEGRKQM